MANSNINRQIGNYRVMSELAGGTFGRVYLAQHTLLRKRTVAIKLLHATYLGSLEERERFVQEAQYLEQLKHPSILPILDVGIDSGSPYLVAEYAPNGSLRHRLKRYSPRPLPLQETLTIITQVGQALQYAHQQHIIHRDIKPENIFFNAKNEALLADFGLATTLTTASLKHVDNAGTPCYMAPEQFQGTISKESDQYALACVAYELVTGRPPFTAQNLYALAFKHFAENPTPPTQFNPSLPASLERAILTALSKQRTDRYRDISGFIKAFSQFTPSPQPDMLTSSQMDTPTLLIIDHQDTPAGPLSRELTHSQMSNYTSDSYTLSQQVIDQKTSESPKDHTITNVRPSDETLHSRNQDPITPLPPFLGSESLLGSDGQTAGEGPGSTIRFSQAMTRGFEKTSHPYHPDPITPLPFIEESEPFSSASSLKESVPFPFAKTWDVNERKRSPRDDLPQSGKRGQLVRRQWFIIGLACFVVFTSVIGTFLFVMPPALSLRDGNKVFSGEVLHLHGSNFVPADNVTLTLDTGSPLPYIATKTTQKVQHEKQLGVSLITALQMTVAGQVVQSSAPNTAIPVRSTGSFDVDLVLNDSFPLGIHTIHAVEAVSSRSAVLNFTAVPKPAKLNLQTSTLDFGQPEKGLKIILPIIIGNTGDQLLSWIADTGGTTWLKLSTSAGTIKPTGREQIIYVTADTSHLTLGAYTATLHIQSNGGSALVEARLVVVPPNPHKQAKLSVNPSALGFGRIGLDKRTTLMVTVGNVGDLALSWQAKEANTNWLTLDRSSGVVQPGGFPQTIQATANTTHLTPGNYSENLQINSSGGQATVRITLIVNPTSLIVVTPTPTSTNTPTPTPTDTPTPIPTDTPTPIPTDTPTPVPTDTPTPIPTDTPTPTPTDTPTPIPTDTPTPIPTDTPTSIPTDTPTPAP